MNISELSEKTSASPRSIRYYEKMGLITPGRSQNGYRVFNQSHIKVVNDIVWLLEAGLSLKNIKYIVPCTLQKTEILMCHDLKNLFEEEINNIEARIKVLRKSQRILKKTLSNSILVKDE